MNRKLPILFSAVFLAGMISLFGQGNNREKIILNPGVLFGYNRGIGLQGNVTAMHFREGFPFTLRMGLGITFLNPVMP